MKSHQTTVNATLGITLPACEHVAAAKMVNIKNQLGDNTGSPTAQAVPMCHRSQEKSKGGKRAADQLSVKSPHATTGQGQTGLKVSPNHLLGKPFIL